MILSRVLKILPSLHFGQQNVLYSSAFSNRRVLFMNKSTTGASKQSLFLHSERVQQEIVLDEVKDDKNVSLDIISKVNTEIKENSHSRLFAVVHLCGKQFKVTDEDLVIVEGYWPPQIGDKIRLDKVLLVGSTDFTLIGRPLLSTDLVSVEATVIEKTLSHTKTHFRKKRRKQYMRINFYRIPQTMLRINSIEFKNKVNEVTDAEGLNSNIF